MPECAKAVEKLGKISAKVLRLSTKSTVNTEYLTSQVFFTHSFYIFNEHAAAFFRQALGGNSNLLVDDLYPFSTITMTTTNLIKD